MRAILLMNFVAPYRVPLLEALRDRIGHLQVLLSTRMEGDRAWVPDWGTLQVAVQRTLTLRRRQSHAGGSFTRQLEIHLPYDTLPRLADAHPDAVISGELGLRSLQAALYRLTRRGMPLLIWATLSERSERDWGWSRRLLRQFILKCADGVFVNGESGARYIRRFGVPDQRIFRLNQPVDVALFANEPRNREDDGACRLLFSGMLTNRKGVKLLAEAAKAWAAANPGRRLDVWWLGDGELAPSLSGARLPPNLRFRLLGHLAYDRLPAVYAQADIFVLPTLLDEWGLVVNEAMASGLPVLGSIHSQAVEELVTDGVEGWRFDPLSPASFGAALDRALAAPAAERAAMGAAGRRRISTLTPATAAERMAQAVFSVRASLAAKGRARGGPVRGLLRSRSE